MSSGSGPDGYKGGGKAHTDVKGGTDIALVTIFVVMKAKILVFIVVLAATGCQKKACYQCVTKNYNGVIFTGQTSYILCDKTDKEIAETEKDVNTTCEKQ